jgi:hypothetical protein
MLLHRALSGRTLHSVPTPACGDSDVSSQTSRCRLSDVLENHRQAKLPTAGRVAAAPADRAFVSGKEHLEESAIGDDAVRSAQVSTLSEDSGGPLPHTSTGR